MRDDGLITRCLPCRRGSFRGWGSVLVVWLVAAACYASLASSSSLWDRDEPRFARAAVEMRDAGDWLLPRFNGDLRPDKPILIYWLMSGGLWLLGFGELAVRLPSVLAVPTAGALTYLIARRLVTWDASAPDRGPPRSGQPGPRVDPHRVGLWAMVILLTSLTPIYIGTAATADGVLLLCITAAVALLIEAARANRFRGRAWWAWIGCGVALGLAQLTKGPVALGVVGLMGIAMMIFGWRRLTLCPRFPLGLVTAIAISLAMFIAWGWPANQATGGELAAEGLGRHVGERMVTAMEGHGGEGALEYVLLLPAYVPMVMIGLGGWVTLLPLGVRLAARKAVPWPRARLIASCWFLPGFVMFSLVATKLPHYVLPLLPAVAAWLGLVLEDQLQRRERPAWAVWWRRLGGWFYAGGAAVFAGGMLIVPWALDRSELGVALSLPGVMLAITAGAAVVWHYRGELRRAGVMIALGTLAVAVLIGQRTMPVLEAAIKPSPDIAAAVRDQWGERADTMPIATEGYNEPSVMFYLNRPAAEPVGDFGGSFERWRRADGPAVLIITEAKLEALGVGVDELGERVSVLGAFDVINYADSAKAKTVLVLSRSAGAGDAS